MHHWLFGFVGIDTPECHEQCTRVVVTVTNNVKIIVVIVTNNVKGGGNCHEKLKDVSEWVVTKNVIVAKNVRNSGDCHKQCKYSGEFLFGHSWTESAYSSE